MGDHDCLFATYIFGRVLVKWFVCGAERICSVLSSTTKAVDKSPQKFLAQHIELQKERAKR